MVDAQCDKVATRSNKADDTCDGGRAMAKKQ